MSKLVLFVILLANATLMSFGQRNNVADPKIASLQVMAGKNWMGMPVIELGQPTPITISFDVLTHNYHRYIYKVEHCDADWSTSSGIFESDYCEGFAQGNVIENLRQSQGTNQLYTHYTLRIPNEKCILKLSGNYKVSIYDEQNEDSTVLTACFMVVEPMMKLSMEVSANTDAGINDKYQQVSMKLDFGNTKVTDPSTQIKTVVLQNGLWHTAARNAKPQYVTPNGMAWSHNKDLIFDGGNEFRKFEMLDMNHATMGLESVSWDGHTYHATVWKDTPRPNYIYNRDADGAFYPRTSDNYDNDVTSEYAVTHFRLVSPRLQGEVYLNGAWTNDYLSPKYKMTWNDTDKLYQANVLLKQGYYNYQYVLRQPNGKIVLVPSEGNFFQTQNTYQALVYYRGVGDRTDRLVAYKFLKYQI